MTTGGHVGFRPRFIGRQAFAPGGARDYRAGGQLIGGVALIAWPASYLSSGVKTFLCGLSGIVFERDFGAQTAAKVAKIQAYDPAPGWMPAK